MKKQDWIPGHIFKIKIDGFYIYGRILNYGDVALYDLRCEEEITNLSKIITSKIMLKAFAEEDWTGRNDFTIIGHIDLEKKLRSSKYWLSQFRYDGLCLVFDNGMYFDCMPAIARLKMEPVWWLTPEEVCIVVRKFYSDKYKFLKDITYAPIKNNCAKPTAGIRFRAPATAPKPF